jgi:hypothetical protein
MGIRGMVRDAIYIYFAWMLINSVIIDIPLTVPQTLLMAGVLLFFSIWFFLERFGVIPKL